MDILFSCLQKELVIQNYRCSFNDGIGEAVQFLYLLNFDENVQDILLTCLNCFEIINSGRNHFYDFAILAIQKLPQEYQQKMLVIFIERVLNQKSIQFTK